MINTLEINRFKSIKSLTLNCRKFNLFIGEPNTGKSNILEALGLWSFLSYGDQDNAREFFRFEQTLDLYYDGVIDEPLEIRCDDVKFSLRVDDGFFTGLLGDHPPGESEDVNRNRAVRRTPAGVVAEETYGRPTAMSDL